jgi:long-chain acyl-CoA synthetase
VQKTASTFAIASPARTGKTVDSPWRTHRANEPRRSDKKDAVLLAGARLFTRKGFQGTSLDDIAQSLGVTKPTLYYYIANKEEILIECVERGLTAFHQGLAALVESGLGGRDLLRAAMALYAEVVTSDFGMCASRVGEDPLSGDKRRALRQRKGEVDVDFRLLIEQGMQRGWILAGDAAVAAFTVVGALSGIGRWYRPETHSAESLQDAVQHCIEMLLRGVLSAPASAPFFEPPQGLAAMTALRRENHFENRLVLCYAQRPANLAEMLASALVQRPEALAVVFGDMRLSWRELHHAATKCAAGLAQHGVASGDRVAMHLGNSPEFIIVTLACAWMGAVLVPISARARGMELEYVLSDSGAVALICAPDVAQWQPTPDQLPALRERFVTGTALAEGFEPFASLMQAQPQVQPHTAQEEDLAVLIYTSGTTGRPKGAMLTHLNIVHSVMHYVERMGLSERDISMVAVPMSHVTGLVAQLYTMLYCQGRMVVMPQFRAADFARLASAERITHTIMVPAMYNLCLLLPDLQAHDLGAWRIGAFGGASMPTATIDGLAQRLPGLVLMNAYGATETCSPATMMPEGQTDSHRDSVGLPVPCGEICIMDEAGFEVAPGGVGEIWIAGPMVVPGYWRNEAATASEFKAGFWRSGDIGSMDTQGYLRVLDRKKDVINRGGYKVYCAQVENMLNEHSDVLEVALVGVPCAVLGERVHAFVSVREISQHSNAQALQAFCSQRMADYAVPETWTIDTEPLPRNLNGKIIKRELRQTLHAALI